MCVQIREMVSGLGVRVSGGWTWDFRIMIRSSVLSGFGFRISGRGFRVSGFGFLVSGFEFRV